MTKPSSNETLAASSPGDPTPAEQADSPESTFSPTKATGLVAVLLDLLNRRMTFPDAYAWLLLLSALDVILTWVILFFGGHEVNPLANQVYIKWDLEGMIVYKFALILFFIAICEIVANLRRTTGKMLSRVSVIIAAFPVVWSLTLLSRYFGLIG